jgi:2-polyprenyl-3-methyl-5-hydroxy-6-metoxy-1,4-benzoquinol methylase
MDSSEYNSRHYTELFGGNQAGYYESISVKIQKALSMFGRMEGKSILDVGCGDGFITSKIGGSTGARMTGVDISREALASARRFGVRAKYANLDRGRLPFGAASFDAAFCGDVVEHVFDTESLLSEVRRVLKPDGFVVMSVPNIAAWYNRVLMLFGVLPVWVESGSSHYVGSSFVDKGMGHVKAFTKRSALQLLALCGFSPVEVAGVPLRGDGKRGRAAEGVWNRADGLFSKFPSLSSQIMIKAVKSHKKV